MRVAIIRPGSPMNGCSERKNYREPRSSDENAYMKRSVVTIRNKDRSCGFRALAVGIYNLVHVSARLISSPPGEDFAGDILEDLGTLNRLTSRNFANMKDIRQEWENMRKQRKIQKESAETIRIEADLPENSSLSKDNILQTEQSLNGIRIIVVDRSTKNRIYPHYIRRCP